MMKWLFENKEAEAKRKSRAELLKTALESKDALEKAAKGTMNLAADVTETLQARIDDYSSQIDQTSRLLSDALLLVNTEGKIQSFNPAAETMFGWRKREIIGKQLDLLFEFNDNPIIDSAFLEEFMLKVNSHDDDVGINYEDFMGVCKDQTTFYVDISASKLIRSDKQVFYIILVRNVTQRVNSHKTIKKLAEDNQDLLKTIDASNTGFMILVANGTDYDISFVNEGFARLTGFKRSAIQQMNLRDLFGSDSVFWSIRKTLKEEIEGRHEFHFEIGVNQATNFEVHITPVKKASGPSQWILVFYDTTDLKKAHYALGRSQASFKAFSEASSESLIIHDHHRLMEWNDRAILLTGYTDLELENMHPFDLLHPLERERLFFKKPLEGDANYETLFVTKDGEVKEVAINSKEIDWDNTSARIAIIRDVTEFKDVETQLRTSRERYKTVVDNTIDLIVCFNSNFEITFSNQTFRDYFEVELEDINGFSLLEIIPKSDHEKFIDHISELAPGREIRRGVHRVQRHDEIRWQDWIDRGLFDEDGNLIEIQSVARDITHLIPD